MVNDLPPKDRDIAMVFQNYALYPHMTVADNLAFGLKLRHTPKAEIKRRVGEAAALLGLEPYLNRKPAALSGGQRQRVAMGRAIVREPAAFLMDEPLSNLDAKLRVSMRAALNQLHERLGTTTVYVTHDQVEAMTLGERVCVLRDGQLQQVDTPQALFDAPVNLFVAGFIGSPRDELRRPRTWSATTARRSPSPGTGCRSPPRCISGKPGLDEYLGKKVILGIRPSDFEDGAFADAAWPRIGDHDRGDRGTGHRDPRDLHHRRAAGRARLDHQRRRRARRGGRHGHRAGRRQVAVDRPGVLPLRRPPRPARSSSPSTPAACTSSTRQAASPSATRSPQARRPPPTSPDPAELVLSA